MFRRASMYNGASMLGNVILLMVQKSGVHSPVVFGSLSQYLQDFSTIPGVFFGGFQPSLTHENGENGSLRDSRQHVQLLGGELGGEFISRSNFWGYNPFSKQEECRVT